MKKHPIFPLEPHDVLHPLEPRSPPGSGLVYNACHIMWLAAHSVDKELSVIRQGVILVIHCLVDLDNSRIYLIFLELDNLVDRGGLSLRNQV